MGIEFLATLTGVGILIAFALGFVFGMGCEQAESKMALTDQHRRVTKAMDEMTQQSIKAIEKAYQMGREYEKQRTENEWKEFVANFEEREKEIKYGEF